MPNWCINTYTIEGKKKDIDRLWDAIEEARSRAYIDSDFGETWLGHLLAYTGMSDDEICKGPVRCRGRITWADKEDNCITIDTETAWAPMHGPIMLITAMVAPNVPIKYLSIEPGMGIYYSNDPEYAGKYLVDVWEDGDAPESLKYDDYHFWPPDELQSVLEEALGHSDDLDKLVEEAMKKWSDSLSISRIEFYDIEDY